VPVADLDGIGAAPGGQQAQDVTLEEGPRPSGTSGEPAAERHSQAVDHLAQERAALLGVVHVAGPFFTRRMWPVWATWASSG